jgi:hypothetical protein
MNHQNQLEQMANGAMFATISPTAIAAFRAVAFSYGGGNTKCTEWLL